MSAMMQHVDVERKNCVTLSIYSAQILRDLWSLVPLNKSVMMHHLSGYAILQFYGIMVFYWPVSLRACSTGHVDCVHHNHAK